MQYVDYTLWQREQLGELSRSAVCIAGQVGYWEQALAGLPERLELPTDRPYPPVADFGGASVGLAWPAQLQARVARVAREHDATSFMVVQAALAVLLGKLSASSDVAVGFPIAGRRDPALDELVGFFVNTLVLRVDLDGDPTVGGLLEQVRQRSLGAFEHQDVPFEVLVDRLEVARSLTHQPLVQVMLAWQNFTGQPVGGPAPAAALGEVTVSPLTAETRTARMDVVFSLGERFTESGELDGIAGSVEFRTDVFDPATIEVLVERLGRVLAALTEDPSRRLSSVDVLDEVEHARLDAVGNRAVLTEPMGAGGVDSGVVRGAGGACSGCGGGVVCGSVGDVSGARRGLESVGASAGGDGCGSGSVGGGDVLAVGRGGHRDRGGAQDWGGVCADGSGASGCAGGVRAR